MRLAFLFVLFLGCGHATIFTAATCNSADLNTQIALASSLGGDTVQCNGAGTWTSFTISKPLILQCSGSCSITGPLAITPSTVASQRIIGFTMTDASGGYSVASSASPMTSTGKPIRIDHNSFASTFGAINTFAYCGAVIMIDNNTFTGLQSSAEIIHTLGINGFDTGTDPGWHCDVTPGGASMIYVEHNTFSSPSPSTSANSCIQISNNSAVVFRYNNLDACAIDVHGDGGATGKYVGGRYYEIYGVNFTDAHHVGSQDFNIRAGSGLVWGNTSNTTHVWQIAQETTAGTWPFCWQAGRGYDTSGAQGDCYSSTGGAGGASNPQDYSPIRVWGNTTSSSAWSLQGPVQEGRDFLVWNGSNWSSTTQGTTQPSLTAPVSLTKCESANDSISGNCVNGTSSASLGNPYSYQPFTDPYPTDASGFPCPTCELQVPRVSSGSLTVSGTFVN